MRRLAFLFLVACAGSEPAETGSASVTASPFTADDVTVLAPLDLTTPSDGLLPAAVASQIGMLVEHSAAEDSLARLRVVCTRFDPKGQVRFVLQPLVELDGVVTAQDAAVHVFYDVEPRAMASRLAAPHDALVLGRELASRGTLSRVTFMRNTDVKGNGWSFGGFDIVNGNAAPIVVGRVGGSSQNVVINGSGPFAMSLAPAPSADPTLGLLLDPVRLGILREANPASARAQVDKGVAAALALEDPAKFDNNTADCASCHLAEPARNFGLAGTKTFSAAETLRACGYVGVRPIISRRTKNESEDAARKMGELL